MRGPTSPALTSSGSILIWLVALFLIALGQQLWVAWLYGSPVPIWDQWDQARLVFRPWLDGNLRLGDLFIGDSNHRIVVTHLLDLGLISVNGRWDPLVQMTMNACLKAIFAAGLAWCLWHFFGRRHGWFICFLLVPFFALPFDGENAIWGMNSLWYLIDIFGLTTIVGLGFARAGSWRWWIGVAGAVLGLLTMASGMLAPVAVAGLVLLRLIRTHRWERGDRYTLGTCVILMLLGVPMIAMPDNNRHWQAHSFLEFTAGLTHNLSWPFPGVPPMLFIVALPLILLLVFYLRPEFPAARAAELVLVLALWSVLQSMMIAYGRANYVAILVGSRYMGVFSLFAIASVFAAMLVGRSRGLRWDGMVLPLIFTGILMVGLVRVSLTVVDDVLVATRQWNLIAEERLETFFTTGDERELFKDPTVRPSPATALEVVRDPKLSMILPPTCLAPGAAVTPGRLSPPAHGLLRASILIMTCGFALFLGGCIYGLRRETMGLAPGNPAGLIVLLALVMALGVVWLKRDVRRETVERDLHEELTRYFKERDPARSAIHGRKAEETAPANQFAN